MHRFLVLITGLLLLLFSSTAHAQNKSQISGAVFDAETDQPIIGAHVFLNGTTLGTVTGNDGTFKLPDIPEGIYQLVIRYVGFQEYGQQINTEDSEDNLTIYLREDLYELGEINVISNRKQWLERLETFETKFLGVSKNAEQTEILNPEILQFEFDEKNRILTATAYEPLIIHNNGLGYEIKFYLKEFFFDEKNFTSAYYGIPFFNEMEPGDKETQEKWIKNRKFAYWGSLQHFIESLIEGTYHEQGFEIKAEIRENRRFREVSKDTVRISDIFYRKDDTTYELSFKHFLNVTYQKEIESYEYRMWQSVLSVEQKPRTVNLQNSVLTLKTESLLIDQSGYVYNPQNYLVGGYWAFEVLADLLPINYKLEEN
ncbi:MAG: hypothetical protein CL670_13675 [Balneola sp.]|nr:hypothetical protein [Balneola sp.]MBE80201.1 hypothetical protein [Balneola sp.]|tara:strand:- start:10726 stop:11838 length:1113 start_codon:yes stop_codon:yes gene_type:complete